MQLFYAPDIRPPHHTLSEEESKHCIRVLRLGRGSRIHITDGRGTLYECAIAEADPRGCRVEVVAARHEFEKMPYGLTMAVAPTKNPERFEWFLEKATEVGVTRKSGVDFGTRCDRTFIDAVLTGDASKIRSPYSDACRSTAFTLACNRSMETGLPKKIFL